MSSATQGPLSGKPLRVLIIEDSEDDTVLLLRYLKQHGYSADYQSAITEAEVKRSLAKGKWDVIISDYILPGFSGLGVLKLLQAKHLDIPCIIVSGRITDEIAIAAMKAGARDFIMKDNLKRIGPAVERELAEWVMRRRHRQAERKVKQRTAELARANKQLKQYAAEIVRAQEEERKRIAYELHDDTAQYLSILKLQLDALLKSGKIQDTEIIEKLKYLQKDADRAFNDIRRYSHELRPVVLEHMGLAASLEQTADDINLLKEITVELELEGQEPPMADDIKLGLFRIAQEAINNVRKHARGSLATVCLQFKNSHVRLMVTDTGPGFDLQSAIVRKRKTGNLGLLSMRERAQLIGADLNIVSERGQGTTVTAEIKL